MSSVRTLTLADAARPRAGVLHDVLVVIGAGLVTAAAARIALPLPWSPVPLTAQTFAVLLTGAALGARRAALAQALYLVEGTVGLPVFAGGLCGPLVLAGPTGGFLLAFPLAAAVTGLCAEHGWNRRFGTMLASMLLGSAVILAGGLVALSRFVPADRLLAAGLLPFLPGDVIKALAAALALPAVWRFANGHASRADRDRFGA
jgi:biotin transport system substrate-specific component